MPKQAVAHITTWRGREAPELGIRVQIERFIETRLDEVGRLIALLDRLDGDAEAEPSLGAGNPYLERFGHEIRDNLCQIRWGTGAHDDLEDQHDGLEPDADAEPPDQPHSPWAI